MTSAAKPDIKHGYTPSKRCVIAGCTNEADGLSTCCAMHLKPNGGVPA